MNLKQQSQAVQFAGVGVEREETEDVKREERRKSCSKIGIWEEAKEKGQEPRKMSDRFQERGLG